MISTSITACPGEVLWANRTYRHYGGYIPVGLDEGDLAKLVDDLFEPFRQGSGEVRARGGGLVLA